MTGPSDDGQAGVTAQRRHDLADVLHDALCNECGAGTGFDFRSADTDKAFAKLIPLLQRWQAEDRAAEREKARAPLLALATYWEEGQRKHSEYWVRADAAANAIRRAAEEGQQ